MPPSSHSQVQDVTSLFTEDVSPGQVPGQAPEQQPGSDTDRERSDASQVPVAQPAGDTSQADAGADERTEQRSGSALTTVLERLRPHLPNEGPPVPSVLPRWPWSRPEKV